MELVWARRISANIIFGTYDWNGLIIFTKIISCFTNRNFPQSLISHPLLLECVWEQSLSRHQASIWHTQSTSVGCHNSPVTWVILIGPLLSTSTLLSRASHHHISVFHLRKWTETGRCWGGETWWPPWNPESTGHYVHSKTQISG